MPKPYSYNIRQKAIQAITLDGFKIIEASEMFNISCNTISLWLKRQAETGDCQAIPYNPRGNGHKITDWDKFRKFAQEYGQKTQVEMAEIWQGEISDVASATLRDRTISRALKKIGFTRTKRPMAIESGMRLNEENL